MSDRLGIEKNGLEIAYYISVEKKLTEMIRKFLVSPKSQEFEITKNEKLKIIKQKDSDDSLVPFTVLNNNFSYFDAKYKSKLIEHLNKISNSRVSIVKRLVKPEEYKILKSRSLKEALMEKLPEDIVEMLPSSFDVIGNIAITEIDRWNELLPILMKNEQTKKLSIEQFKSLIGETIISLFKNIETILNKIGNIEGEFRVRNFELIAGKNATSTIHKENDCFFALDISKMFFTPRLVFERNRVSDLIYNKNDVVLDCFSGVGPFSIEIATKHPIKILSCEKNPDAYDYLLKNLRYNRKRIKGDILSFCGDFRNFKDSYIAQDYLGEISHIIMNLPERNLEFIKELKPYIKDNGTLLIIYLFAPEPEPIENAINILEGKLMDCELKLIEIINSRIVKNFSPRIYTVALDVIISK